MTARRIPICKRVCETFSLSANKAEPCGCRRAAASHDCGFCLFILPHRLRQGEALASFSRRLSLEGAGKAQSRCMFSCYFSGSGKDSAARSEEHTSELQSLMRISYAVFGLKNKTHPTPTIEKQAKAVMQQEKM